MTSKAAIKKASITKASEGIAGFVVIEQNERLGQPMN